MPDPAVTHNTNPTAFADDNGITAPHGPSPIPYPDAGPLATGWHSTNDAQRVKLQAKHGVNADQAGKLTGSMSHSTGDQAGVSKGLVSPKTSGKPGFMNMSSKVKFEGHDVSRFADMTTHNHGG